MTSEKMKYFFEEARHMLWSRGIVTEKAKKSERMGAIRQHFVLGKGYGSRYSCVGGDGCR